MKKTIKEKVKVKMTALEIAKKRERDFRTKLEKGVMKRREARDKVRKAIALKEGVNWKRVVLVGKVNGDNTDYIIKKSK